MAEGESDSQAPTPFIFLYGSIQLDVAGVVDSDVDPRMRERATKSHFIKKERNKEINWILFYYNLAATVSCLYRH